MKQCKCCKRIILKRFIPVFGVDVKYLCYDCYLLQKANELVLEVTELKIKTKMLDRTLGILIKQFDELEKVKQ